MGNIRGRQYVGGITGRIDSYSNITNSYSIGNVKEGNYLGGIVGYVHGSNIVNTYSIGNVSGSYYVGGIAGYGYYSVIENNAVISQSVIGREHVNRVIGYIEKEVDAYNNIALNTMVGGDDYNNYTNINPIPQSDHGRSKTEIELKTQSTYSNGLGWSFDGDNAIWKIDQDKNNGYPYLYWQE